MARHRILAVLAATLVLSAGPALAQSEDTPSPARRLGSPTGEPARPELEDVAIPEPPGSNLAPEAEVRYPVPSAEDATRSVAEEEDERPSIRIPSRVTTRLRALDANLQALAAQGGSNIVNAVLSLLTGGLAITLGALRPDNDDPMSIYLYVYGGTAAIRGVLELSLTPNASGPAITYQHMPMGTHDEVRERLDYGERALAGLAEQGLIARILDASLNMAAGVAVVPIYLAPVGFEIREPLDYFVLIGAGVSIVSGIITLATTSAAEQRWSAYQQLRDRLRQERELERRGDTDADDESEAPRERLDAPASSARLGGGPLPGGGFLGVAATF